MGDSPLGSISNRITTVLGSVFDRALLLAMQAEPTRDRKRNGASGARAARDRKAELLAATEFYARPEIQEYYFAAPPAVRISEKPVRSLVDGEVVDLSFPSTHQVLWEEARADYSAHGKNEIVHARMLRHRRPVKSVAICIHGYRGGNFFLEERAFNAKYFYERGLDVVLFTLPFHGRRAGDGPLRWPGPNIGRLNEGFAQAIADLRALIAWLRQREMSRVAVLGMSLGGYTTALLSTVEPVEFAAPIIPVGSFADLIWSWGTGVANRDRAERDGVTLEMVRAGMAIHSPLLRRPRVPGERMLVISAQGDRIAPPEHATWLARHFACDEIRFPGGHILQVGRKHAFDELLHRFAGVGVL